MNDPYSQASSILNQVAPEGERLAYINPYEEALLRQIGGSGHEHIAGIPSYNFFQDAIDGRRPLQTEQERQLNAVVTPSDGTTISTGLSGYNLVFLKTIIKGSVPITLA